MYLKWKYSVVLIICCCFSIAQIPSVWIKTFEQNKTMKQAALGFQVVEITSGKILAEYQSHLALIPASTLKVVTTSSSLCMLGKNYSYSTKILTKGKWDAKVGTIEGDIIIKGNGDPSLQSSYFYKDSNSVCTSWALALKKLGVKTITGNCIGDASSFSKSINPNWIWGDIGNYFGASFNGLSFHDNKFSVFFTSGSLGSKATVSNIEPNYVKTPVSILSSVIAKGSEDEAYVYGDPYGFTKDISGNIPPNKTNYEVEAALPDPALLCAETFAKALKKENILIDEKKCQSTYQKNTNDSTIKLTELYAHTSPSLERMVYFTNTRSNNHYAESFLATLGKGNTNSGIAAVKNYWDKRGLEVNELFMVDGSGLSRANTITANVLTQLLAKMARDSVSYKSFYNSLPIAGKNGSMTNIGKGTFIENNMRAKTGYINRVRTYCGYVKTKSGKELAFSILLNNYTCSTKEAKQILEDFMIGLADL